MFVCLIKEWLAVEFTLFLVLVVIILSGILESSVALIGFSNPGVHTVALLFIISSAVSRSGILDTFIQKALGEERNIRYLLARIMLPISTMSAFMSNTPIVTMLIPTLQNLANINHVKPSKLLIPLSYAAITGGTITLVGTSTNLMIQGFLVEKGLEGFHFFEFAYFGVPITICCFLYFVTIGHFILPSRDQYTETFQREQKDYIHKFVVHNDSPLVGKTVNEAMLRQLDQLFLVQIVRTGHAIIPNPDEDQIQVNDILVFSGNPEQICHLENQLGLSPYIPDGKHNSDHNLTSLYEVGISTNSPIVSKKIKESHFRSKYNASIISIKRRDKVIYSGIGRFVLKPGDILLVLAKKDFVKSWADTIDFYFISPVNRKKTRLTYKKFIIIGIILSIVICSSFQILSIFKLVLLATVLLILTRVMTLSDAIKSINWDIIILMGCAIGIGKAFEKTGLAEIVANLLIHFQPALGLMGTIILFYLITLFFTELLNNLATSALMFPIGFSISEQLQLDPLMFGMITAIAASCSFLTPIGYQTNLLVYGPGGYKFSDYFKVGLPLSLLCMIITIVVAYLKWIK